MSETDKTVIKLAAFTVLDNTGDFYYVKADVDDENNLIIWYIPKKTDSSATIIALGEVIGAYSGLIQSNPDISNAYIFVGTEGDEKGSLYCLRSWISYGGKMTNDEAGTLVLKVLGTFKDLS